MATKKLASKKTVKRKTSTAGGQTEEAPPVDIKGGSTTITIQTYSGSPILLPKLSCTSVFINPGDGQPTTTIKLNPTTFEIQLEGTFK